MNDVLGIGHVEGGGDDCRVVRQWRLIPDIGGGQSGYTGFFGDYTTGTAASPKTAVCGVVNRIYSLIVIGGVDQYDFAHGDFFLSHVTGCIILHLRCPY